jgi:hypothetical protein
MKTTSTLLKLSPLAALLLLGACVTTPTGPSVLVLPGTGKSFEQFRADDNQCRQFATGQIGNTTAGENAVDSGMRSAAIGTALGAVAGAAFGGSRGAGVGAGAGLLMGSAEGSNASQRSSYTTQQRYDNSYIQCMYSYGHRVPVSGRLMTEPSQSTRSVPPPPPPGLPPPPPPSAR